MNKNLLILGAGQYGQVTKEIAESMGRYDKIDFLDDVNTMAIGSLNDYMKFLDLYKYAIVAIGNPEVRLEWLSNLEDAGYEIPTLTHPRAYISTSSKIMKGCIVEPMAVINASAEVRVGCIISTGAVVNHNALCSAGVHIDCNATVAANAVVPSGTKVFSGTVYNKSNMEDKNV